MNGHDENGEVRVTAVDEIELNLEDRPNRWCYVGLLCSPLLLVGLLVRDIVVILGLALISVLVGLFVLSFELLTVVDKKMCVVLVLFLPLTMVVGLLVGLKEIFWKMAPDFLGAFWKDTCTIIKLGLGKE